MEAPPRRATLRHRGPAQPCRQHPPGHRDEGQDQCGVTDEGAAPPQGRDEPLAERAEHESRHGAREGDAHGDAPAPAVAVREEVACVDSPVRPRPTPPPTPTEATMTPREGACAPRRMPPAADPRPVITTSRGLPRATNQPAIGPRAAATNQMNEMGEAMVAREA